MDYSCQAPLSMKFSRQEYWSGLPFSALGDIPVPGIKPTSLASSALAGGFFTGGAQTGTSGGNTQTAEQTRTTQSAGNKHGAQQWRIMLLNWHNQAGDQAGITQLSWQLSSR